MSSPLHNAELMEIRSFRVVFALERRLHRIDRFRLPLPYGVPLRGLAYAAVALLLIVLAGRLPVVGELIGLAPAPFRYMLLPAGTGFLLARARVDGRPAHGFALAWLRFRAAPKRINAFRPTAAVDERRRIFDPIVFMPDDSAATYRPARVKGPATIRVAYPANVTQRGTRLVISQAGVRPLRAAKLVEIPAGGEVVVQ